MNKLKFLLKNKILIFLILIVLYAGFVRIYKIDQAPPSLSWDEVAVGYNAWTIANWGKDERGKVFPAYFASFLDDKHPVDIYITSFFVKLLGLSEFSIRFPSALFGILNVVVVFFLARVVFKSNSIGVLSSFLFAISPYDIHFSRFNHELNFTIFFFTTGLYLFFKGLEKKNSLLSISLIGFGISFLSYHSAKVVIPLTSVLLFVLYFKELRKLKKNLYTGLVFLFLIGLLIFFNPQLLGFARAGQTLISEEMAKNTFLYGKTQNLFVGKLNLILGNYFSFFSLDYLFINGDKNPRLSSQVSGQFYLFDLPFILIGIYSLLYYKKKKSLILLFIIAIAPLAGSLSAEIPHAARAMFTLGSIQIITAFGIFKFVKFFRPKKLQIAVLILIILSYALLSKNYFSKYFSEYVDRFAIDWQYGMKQVVDYVRNHPEYSEIYMTNVRSQPYIFFLLYTKKPLPEYLLEVEYNNTNTRSFNLVASFDRYHFEYWDPIESTPDNDRLYILTPSQYDGLRYKSFFKIKKIVYYPDGGSAFYLINSR